MEKKTTYGAQLCGGRDMTALSAQLVLTSSRRRQQLNPLHCVPPPSVLFMDRNRQLSAGSLPSPLELVPWQRRHAHIINAQGLASSLDLIEPRAPGRSLPLAQRMRARGAGINRELDSAPS